MLDLRLGFAGLIAHAVLPRIKRQLQSPKNVNLAQLAEYSSIDFETISTETEEGQMLKNASGGIAASCGLNNGAKTQFFI